MEKDNLPSVEEVLKGFRDAIEVGRITSFYYDILKEYLESNSEKLELTFSELEEEVKKILVRVEETKNSIVGLLNSLEELTPKQKERLLYYHNKQGTKYFYPNIKVFTLAFDDLSGTIEEAEISAGKIQDDFDLKEYLEKEGDEIN